MISKVYLPKKYKEIQEKKKIIISNRRFKDDVAHNFFSMYYLSPVILIFFFFLSLSFLKTSSPLKFVILSVTVLSIILLPLSLKALIKNHKSLKENQKKKNYKNAYLKAENDTLTKYQGLISKFGLVDIFKKIEFLEKTEFLNKKIIIHKNISSVHRNHQMYFLFFLNYFYGNKISYSNSIDFEESSIQSDFFCSYKNTGVFIDIFENLDSNSNIQNKFANSSYAYVAFNAFEILNFPIECCLLISDIIERLTGKPFGRKKFHNLNYPYSITNLADNRFTNETSFNLYDKLEFYPFLNIRKGDFLIYRFSKDTLHCARFFPKEIRIDDSLKESFKFNKFYKINLSEYTLGEPIWSNLKLNESSGEEEVHFHSTGKYFSSNKNITESSSGISDDEFFKVMNGDYWKNFSNTEETMHQQAEDLEMIPVLKVLNEQ